MSNFEDQQLERSGQAKDALSAANENEADREPTPMEMLEALGKMSTGGKYPREEEPPRNRTPGWACK